MSIDVSRVRTSSSAPSWLLWQAYTPPQTVKDFLSWRGLELSLYGIYFIFIYLSGLNTKWAFQEWCPLAHGKRRLSNLGENTDRKKNTLDSHLQSNVTRQKQKLKTNLCFGCSTYIISLTTGYNPMRNND